MDVCAAAGDAKTAAIATASASSLMVSRPTQPAVAAEATGIRRLDQNLLVSQMRHQNLMAATGAAAPTERGQTSTAMAVSLNSDIAAPDDPGPERSLILQLGGKLRTRLVRHHQAEGCELLGDRRIAQGFGDGLIEQHNDCVRRSAGHGHAPPIGCDETRKAAAKGAIAPAISNRRRVITVMRSGLSPVELSRWMWHGALPLPACGE